jgi:hypothetical protein
MQQTAERERIYVSAHELVDTFKRLVHEGNVRRIIIRQDEHVLAEFPLTAGVIGAVFVPMLAMVGTLAALLAGCTIDVEREESPTGDIRDKEREAAGRELEEWEKY